VFSHPSGGKITIDWTMERAKAAGLAGKEVWKQYPRNMLRSRVISEAIRTVYPGVLSGCYLEDEIEPMQAVSTQAPVQALPAPTFPVGSWVQAIQAADSIDGLRDVWMNALKNAQEFGTSDDLLKLTAAKDSKKAELSHD
jgi:hypothetical protein